MDEQKFKRVYNESRNGTDGFTRHPLVRKFAYSDGVRDLAETGCYWLLDIIATEVLKVLRKEGETLGTLTVTVTGDTAHITLTGSGYRDLPWSKRIDMTDMPVGTWSFFVSDERDGDTPFRMILVSEY